MTSVRLFIKSPVPSSGTGWTERSLLETPGQWYEVLLGTRPKWYPEPVPGPVLFITFVKDLEEGAVHPQHFADDTGWVERVEDAASRDPAGAGNLVKCSIKRCQVLLPGRGQLCSKAWDCEESQETATSPGVKAGGCSLCSALVRGTCSAEPSAGLLSMRDRATRNTGPSGA